MNAKKLSYLVPATLVLCLAVAGCKKNLQGTTPLPGSRPGLIGDQPGSPIGPGVTPEGIPLPESRVGWPEDRETFHAQTVYFEFDKSNVKPGEVSKLETVASQMRSGHSGKALRIEGHCDERGTEEYNRSLGERRAQSVREKLVQLGLSASIIETISYGEERPAEPAHDEAAWSKNRRAEIILLSPPSGAITGAGGTTP